MNRSIPPILNLLSVTMRLSKQLDVLAASNVTANVLADVNDAPGQLKWIDSNLQQHHQTHQTKPIS